SRRRHTRFSRDWSSDVCSSDLTVHTMALAALLPYCFSWSGVVIMLIGTHVFGSGINIGYHRLLTHRSFKCPLWVERFFVFLAIRSEERRVGKECRSRSTTGPST